MARGEQRSNREKKKPKKEKIKSIAAAPSQKGAAAGWQPKLASGKGNRNGSRNLTTPNVVITTGSGPDLQHRLMRCR